MGDDRRLESDDGSLVMQGFADWVADSEMRVCHGDASLMMVSWFVVHERE
jgi:hypothetical protein